MMSDPKEKSTLKKSSSLSSNLSSPNSKTKVDERFKFSHLRKTASLDSSKIKEPLRFNESERSSNSQSRLLPFYRSSSMNTVSSLANDSTFNSEEYDTLYPLPSEQLEDQDSTNSPKDDWNSTFMKKLKEIFEFCRFYTLILISNVWFDRVMLLVILLSSAFMAMADYSDVDSSNNLVQEGSIRNTILIQSELVFIVLFTAEFLLKGLALGLCGPHSYFSDQWNWLDFFIVLVSIVTLIPNIPNVRVLRTFRVLRPLKSLKAIPGVAAIVVVFMKSLPAMGDILLLLLFFFVMFAIIGLQLFQGPYMHTRCRLTPFPVNNSWTPNIYSSVNSTYLESMSMFRCLDAPNFDYPNQDPSMTQSSSPWNTPQPNCYWPIDTDDTQLCTLDGSGTHVCENGDEYKIPVTSWRWCGSNYDALGNARFDESTAYLDTYILNLGYSNINFDNLGYSILFVIQNISGDSWSMMEYMISDSINAISGFIYCNIIILLGTFFLLQLNIAILEIAFSAHHDELVNAPTQETLKKEKMIKIFRSLSSNNKLDSTSSLDFLINENLGSIEDQEVDLESFRGTKSIGNNSLTNKSDSSEKYYGECITNWKAFVDKYDKPNDSYFRRGCSQLHNSNYFQSFFSLMILLNTLVLAWDHYPIAQSTLDLLDFFSFLLTLIFTIEFLVSLCGLGINEYFRTNFRIFDALIVFTSLLEVVISPLPTMITGDVVTSKKQLAAVRIFRIFRLMRLFRSKTFKKVLFKMVAVVYSMRDFLILLNLIVFILALIGMNFFANYFRFDTAGFVTLPVNSPAWVNAPDRPRSNFDTFTLSFMSVVQCITIDNWNVIMYNAGRALGPAAMIFPIVCFLFGSILVMNLFLAMLIRNFNNHETAEEFDFKNEPIISTFLNLSKDENDENDENDESDDELNDDSNSNKFGNNTVAINVNEKSSIVIVKLKQNTGLLSSFISTIKNYCRIIISHSHFESFILLLIVLSSITLILDSPLNNPDSDLALAVYYIDVITTSFFIAEMCMKMISMGICSWKGSSYFRDGWNVLDFFVVIFSVLSLGGISQLKALKALRALRPLRLINRLPGLKVMVMALLKSAPEIAQIGIVVLLVYFIFGILFVTFLKGQLRGCSGSVFNNIVSNNESYNSLLVSPQPYNSLNPEQQTWFGPNSPVYINYNNNCSQVWPQQPCCDNYVGVNDQEINSKIICECWGGTWATLTDFRFDNLGAALITLFDDATIDNWTDNMHIVSDSTGIYMEPIRDNAMIWCWVFYIFILFGSYFALQLFIGSITQCFDRSRRELGGTILMTREQEDWIRTHKIIAAIKPKSKINKPSNCFRAICYTISFSVYFEASMNLVIVAQCIFLSISYFQMSDFLSSVISWGQITLAIIFAVEMMIKLVGLGPSGYARDGWNIMDFIIVLASIGALIAFAITGNNNGLIVNLVRVLRVARLVRLLKGVSSIQKLIDAIVLTIPGVINVSILIFLFLFIFSVVCMELYAKTMYNGSYYEDANFRNFGISFATLFRMLTGDNWAQFMYDIAFDTVNCVENPPYDPAYCGFNDFPGCIPLNGCGGWAIIPIMIIFMILMTLIMLSVVISVIISTYNEVNESLVTPDDFEAFCQHWAEYDPEATCYIPYKSLFSFVATLFVPFGFDNEVFSRRQYSNRVKNIKVDEKGRVHFGDVIHALSVSLYERKSKFDENIKFPTTFVETVSISEDVKRISKRVYKKVKATVSGKPYIKKKKEKIETEFKTEFTVAEYLAFDMIYEVWKRKLEKKKQQQENNGVIIDKDYNNTTTFYDKNKIIESKTPSKAWKKIRNSRRMSQKNRSVSSKYSIKSIDSSHCDSNQPSPTSTKDNNQPSPTSTKDDNCNVKDTSPNSTIENTSLAMSKPENELVTIEANILHHQKQNENFNINMTLDIIDSETKETKKEEDQKSKMLTIDEENVDLTNQNVIIDISSPSVNIPNISNYEVVQESIPTTPTTPTTPRNLRTKKIFNSSEKIKEIHSIIDSIKIDNNIGYSSSRLSSKKEEREKALAVLFDVPGRTYDNEDSYNSGIYENNSKSSVKNTSISDSKKIKSRTMKIAELFELQQSSKDVFQDFSDI